MAPNTIRLNILTRTRKNKKYGEACPMNLDIEKVKQYLCEGKFKAKAYNPVLHIVLR